VTCLHGPVPSSTLATLSCRVAWLWASVSESPSTRGLEELFDHGGHICPIYWLVTVPWLAVRRVCLPHSRNPTVAGQRPVSRRDPPHISYYRTARSAANRHAPHPKVCYKYIYIYIYMYICIYIYIYNCI
jgi:hypothetical protein